eukprot:Unigene4238_Nuclearia_a/m.12910 Unigene4238_Nuclearia_a/g.12910  ORF Unigene4238_Nuclearia_a/g.12910 Unigene4238_Nuclearia_a/m.12910 type:complete len:159 (+) Unigene4238_Nuclearia_a:105-581(+)
METLLSIAGEVKALGNKLFQAGGFAGALRKYEKALRYLDEDPEDEKDGDEKTLAEAKVPLRLNCAACQLKLGNKERVVKDCSFVLDSAVAKSADRLKALYRRAQAHVPGDYEAALADLDEALKIDGADAAVKSLQAQYKRELQARKDKEKKAFASLFK